MKKIIVLYDNFCPNCTRFAQLVNKLDWLSLIELKKLRNIQELNIPVGCDLNIALKQMASFNGKWNYGYTSIYYILSKLPIIWLILPIFYILKISRIGQIIYKELAIKRKIIPIHCDEKSCQLPHSIGKITNYKNN